MGTLYNYVTPSGESNSFWNSEANFTQFEFNSNEDRDEFAYKNVDFIANLPGMNYGYPLLRWFVMFIMIGGAPATYYLYLGLFQKLNYSEGIWFLILITIGAHLFFLYKTIQSIDRNRYLFEEAVDRFEKKLNSKGGEIKEVNYIYKIQTNKKSKFKKYLYEHFQDEKEDIEEIPKEFYINLGFNNITNTTYHIKECKEGLDITYTSLRTLFKNDKEKYKSQIKKYFDELLNEFEVNKK